MNKYKFDGYYITASCKENAIKKAKKIQEYEAYGMATLAPELTGLDVPIWVDEDATYKKGGHFRRIKFKAGINQKTTHTYSTMKLENQEIIESTLPKKITDRYSKKVYENIRTFVFNNKVALEELSDKNINMEQFRKAMIKGKQKANPSRIRKQILMVQKMKKEFESMLNRPIEMEINN
jgi:hypothetical protein